MGYRFPVNTVTQRRLAQVIGDRKKDEEEKYSPLGPDIPDTSIPFSDTLGGEGMPGLRIQRIGDRPSIDERRQASRDVTSTGQPRLTDREKAAGITAGTAYETRADDPAVDMQRLQIVDPIKHNQMVELTHDATLSVPDRYNARTLIQQGNVAGADPSHLTVGSHQTPDGKVPLDGRHSKVVVITPEQGNDDIYINELARNLPRDTVLRVEGESQFGTLSAGESFAGLGKVFLGFIDVAGSPFEAFAETAFQATHTLPWNTTLWQDGFSATVEKHRKRGIIAQLAIGVVFDPFVLGKALKIPAGLTRAAARRFIRQELMDVGEIADADKARLADEIVDTVTDTSGYTYDFDGNRWWSPAQNKWITLDAAGQAAHVKEFGAPLIAGGAPAPWELSPTGERLVSPFPGRWLAKQRGRFWPGIGDIRSSQAVQNFALINGITMEAAQRAAGFGKRINMNHVQKLIDERDIALGGRTAREELDEAMSDAVGHFVDEAAAAEGRAMPSSRAQAAYRSQSQQVRTATEAFQRGEGFGMATPYETAEPGALLGKGWSTDAQFNEFLESDWHTWGSRMFGEDLSPGDRSLLDNLRGGQIFLEESIFDTNARIAKQYARVEHELLETYNKWAIHPSRNYIPLNKLPDSFNAPMQFALANGTEAAAENAWDMGTKSVQRALGNHLVGSADKIDTSAVDILAALLHHVDALTMTHVDMVGTQLKKVSIDDLIRAGQGGRVGPGNMSAYQLRQAIASFRRQLGDTQEFRNAKRAHDASEATKMGQAAEVGESYTPVPFEKAQFERVQAGVEALAEHYAHIRELYVDSGILSREMADTLKNMFPFYNPIRYVKGEIKDHVDVFGSGSRRAVGIDQTTYRELGAAGLENLEEPILKAPMQVMGSATREAYRNYFYNNAANALIHQSMYDGTLPDGLVRRVVTLKPGQKLLNFELDGIRQERGSYKGIKLKRVSRRYNGEQEVWEIPEDSAILLENLTKIDYHLGIRIMRMMNRPFRMMFTSHNPVFMAANFLHDMMVVMMNEGVLPWDLASSLYRNLIDIKGNDTVMDTLIRYGGDVGGYTGRTMEEAAEAAAKRRARAEAGLPEFTTYERWARYITSPARGLNYLSRSIEMAPRRATFKKVMDREQARKLAGEEAGLRSGTSVQGSAPVEVAGRTYDPEVLRAAAFAARNVTVDFQKYGNAVKLFDAAFLYTNAAIQGTMLPVRALRRGGVRLGAAPGVPTFSRAGGWKRRMAENRAKMALLGFAGVAMSIYAHNRIHFPDAYKNMSLQDRITRFQVIYGDEEQEDGTMQPKSFSMQPLLREYSSINAGIVLTLDRMFDLDSANAEQFLTALIPQVNPLGTIASFGGRDSTFGMQPFPTITMPGQIINETMRNHDSFRNAPIVDARMARLPAEEQYDEYTSETAKRVGSWLGKSPKKIDHMFRIGAMQDLFISLDQMLQLGNENKTPQDLALDLAAAELEELLENMSATKRPLERNKFFNKYILEYVDENGDIVRNPISSDQRRKIQMLMREEDTGIPVITTLHNRFNRQSGGQLRRTGMIRASENANTDPGQTGEMAATLGMRLSDQYDAQTEVDRMYREGKISAKEWREADREAGIGYQAILYAAMNQYPKAAQAIKTEDGVRSPKNWQEYLTAMRTGLGAWDDPRTQGQIFAAAHRSVNMPLDFDGQPDYAAYFKHIEELRDVIQDEHGDIGTELLDEELMSVMTPMQREYYQEVGLGAQQGGLRSYWDIANTIAMREPGLAGIVYRQFLAANDDVRMLLKDRYGDLISGVQRKVNAAREEYRQLHPTMDYLYVKWGYAEAARTPLGELAVRERLGRGAQTLGFMTAQDPNQPEPQGEVVLR